jgi:hypothetical protein
VSSDPSDKERPKRGVLSLVVAAVLVTPVPVAVVVAALLKSKEVAPDN